MISLRDILSEKKITKKSDFDRAEYYKEYIKQLVPETFKVEMKDSEITIKIKN